MYRKQSVLALLALYVGLANSFSWDIVLMCDEKLQFLNYGKLTHTEEILYYTTRIAYDPIHNNVLLAHRNHPKIAVSSFDIITKKLEPLVRKTADVVGLAFDPLTETIFWVESRQVTTLKHTAESPNLFSTSAEYSVFSFALKPGSNNARNGNLLISSEDSDLKIHSRSYISVDSCGGYIYWIAGSNIEKARFDGSEREVVIYLDSTIYEINGFAIDQQARKMYWAEAVEKYSFNFEISVKSADLNGQNRRTLYIHTYEKHITPFTVANDFIYYGEYDRKIFWQLPKTPPHDRHVKPKKCIADVEYFWSDCDFAAKYKSQTKQSCEALNSLPRNNSVPNDHDSLNDSTDVSLLCVHGTQVSGESRCECTKGYSGERCDVSVCHNYCFHGYCSVSAEGHPKCRCYASYFGERCEVKVNACHRNYCLNNGVCSLNAENKPVCQCTGDYEGKRCNVPVSLVKCFQTVSMLRDILNTDVTPVTLLQLLSENGR